MTPVLRENPPDVRQREIARLAGQVRLPFRSRAWRGSAGSWQGRGQGSSIDFQDHRAYAPGDDPRHLDWAAYARTNHYTMKLFREEVSPRLDVALDVSKSMALAPAKEARSLDLFALVLTTALRDGISLRAFTVSSGRWRPMDAAAALALDKLPPADVTGETAAELPLAEIPWRAGSLRVLISDLLIPQSPERELGSLSRDHGRAVILSPFLQAEATPDWQGNLALHDCESSVVRQQRVEPPLLSRYRKNYQRHFELWLQEARRRGVPFGRISCELPLGVALRQQALPAGTFELRH